MTGLPLADERIPARDDVQGSSAHMKFIAAWAAGAVVLAASLLNFLRYQDYPVLRPEIGIIALIILGLCGLTAIIYQGVRPWARNIMEGLLVVLAAEFAGAALAYAAAAGAAVAVGGIVLRRPALRFLGTMAIIAIVAGTLGVGQERQAIGAATKSAALPQSNAPAVLHVIVDEHIGIEGLPADNPATPAMKDALRFFYLSRGFRLFGRAYSEHLHTVNAIPHMMSLGGRQSAVASPKEGTRIEQNAYFARLGELGYHVNVYQSDFIDYCSAPAVATCTRYSSGGLGLLDSAPLSAADKAGLIAVRFAFLSNTAKGVALAYKILWLHLYRQGHTLPDFGLPLEGRTSSVNALAAFDGLIEDLRAAQPGEVYFAHLLLPHYPYAVDGRCRLRATERWVLRRSMTPRAQREAAYFDQLRCVMTKIDEALDAIAGSPAGRNHIVVLHGDHGSRITTVDPTVANLGSFGDRDFITGFSTLFAARGPALAPGYDDAPASVTRLLSDLARSGFTSLPERGRAAPPPVVTLDDSDWIPRRRMMLPASWSQAGAKDGPLRLH